MKETLRRLPSVEAVLSSSVLEPIRVTFRREYVKRLVQEALALERKRVLEGAEPPSVEEVARRVVEEVEKSGASLRRVVNATGTVTHTNLGRALLSEEALAAIQLAARHPVNLEYDLVAGERGHRDTLVEGILCRLTGAEAATVVNNNAAALVLILRHFIRGDRAEVVLSRGELIQIGGGFRIPEILEASGARLREMGTTNKTSLADYARAIGKQTALILKVHRSNFFMDGFVASPATGEIAALARKKRIPFVEDLGSGALLQTETLGVEHEPTPAEVLKEGVDLVCFSGDKLLGGPQAGIIAGNAKLIAALKREPFFRALRCDKLILAALEATVDAYLRGEDLPPVIEMLRLSPHALRSRAQTLIAALTDAPLNVSLGRGRAQIGGGTLPRSLIESVTLDLLPRHLSLEDFAARLRSATPPVIGYIERGRFKLDLRTIFPRQDAALVQTLKGICA